MSSLYLLMLYPLSKFLITVWFTFLKLFVPIYSNPHICPLLSRSDVLLKNLSDRMLRYSVPMSFTDHLRNEWPVQLNNEITKPNTDFSSSFQSNSLVRFSVPTLKKACIDYYGSIMGKHHNSPLGISHYSSPLSYN